MTEILSIANQKGGVGKTTTAVNLAASLVCLKATVLLIDLDPQGNSTMGSGIEKTQLEDSIAEVLLEETPLAAAIIKTDFGYDLVGANRELAGTELAIASSKQREFILKKAIESLKVTYDFILIDCAPSLSLLTLNALCASNGVLIPMQCEYYALEGLADLSATIDTIKQNLNANLSIKGVIRTLYDPRSTLTMDVSQELTTHFGHTLYETVIPRNIRLAEAPAHGAPILDYDKTSKGAVAYLMLAAEVMKRLKPELLKKTNKPHVKIASGEALNKTSI